MTALENRLRALQVFGQSVWLDYIRRSLITSGELRRLIDEDGLRGVTSNPAIFEKAVAGSSDYKEILEAPDARALDAKTLYERLAVRDIQDAADVLRPVYEETAKRDGYVSLEVSPLLADDTTGTLDEARRLWQAVGRDNLMIKVPATPQGIPAIQQLISEGINVNVTLLFAQETYEQVADAYIVGARGARRPRRRPPAGGQRGQFLHQPDRYGNRCDRRRTVAGLDECEGAGPPARPDRQGGDRQRQARLPAVPRSSSAAGAGRHWPAGARKRSACCGPARARRIPTIATSSTSKS